MNQANIDKVINEGGEGFSFAAHRAAQARREKETQAEAKFEQDVAASKAAFEAEWTLDVLNARRAAWNAEIQVYVDGKKPFNAFAERALVKKLGFGPADLRAAKKMHGIN